MSVDSAPRTEAPTPAPAPPARTPPEWVDRFLGSDPGLTRLRLAAQTVVTIAAAMLVEWVFVRTTHALQIDTHGATLPPAQAALVAAQHHALLIIAIMLGAVVGMIAAFGATMFPTVQHQLVSFALMPVPMVAGLALGLSLGAHRVAALVTLAAVLAVGTYCRRFGPRGFLGGMLLFMGDFFGFFLHGAVTLTDIGWLTVEIALGMVVAIIAQFTLFYPSRRHALRRMRRSFEVRSRQVTSAALAMFEVEAAERPRAARRLHRLLVRLNEAALMIDAQLGDPASVPAGSSATVLHQSLFDAELALTNMARFTVRIVDLPIPADVSAQVGACLAAVAEHDVVRAEKCARQLLERLSSFVADGRFDDDPEQTSRIVVHRFAVSVHGWAAAVAASTRQLDTNASATDPAEPFETSVLLMAGWLPGSALVSAEASLESGTHRRDRVRIAPYTRVAIQMGVAVTGAIILGDLVSGRRFYWAVIAAFVTFMGANNAGEQLRKGFFRIAGTVVGVFIGAVLAHLVGQRSGVAIAVILASLFLGLYFMRISYAFMVVGITVMVSQLYVQLDEFTNSLLVLRLEETALGAGFAALTVLCVLPLRTGQVARIAARQHVEALAALTSAAVARMSGTGSLVQVRTAARRLDSAYQTLVSAMVPLRLRLPGTPEGIREQLLKTATASRHYARNLLIDTASDVRLAGETVTDLARAGDCLAGSLGELAGALRDENRPADHTYVRSAVLFDVVATQLGDEFTDPPQLALRDLQLIDGAMASFARSLGMTTRALDTAGAGPLT